MRRAGAVVVFALLTGGCSAILGIPDPSMRAPDGDGGDADAGTGMENAVTITVSDVYHLEDGSTMSIPGFPGELAAYRRTADGFSDPVVAFPVQGSDGRYAIYGLPPGEEYYLKTYYWSPGIVALDGGYYIVSQARSLDLSREWWGRPGWQSGPTGTRLVFDLFGMTSWQAGDTLALLVPNVVGYYIDVLGGLEVGATQVNELTFNWADRPLVWSSLGDRLHVQHLTPRFIEGTGDVQVVVDEFVDASLEQVGGVSTPVSGTFSPVPNSGSTVVDWPASDFSAALGLSARTTYSYGYGTIEIDPVQLVDLPVLSLVLQPQTELARATVEFANPFPDDFGLTRVVDVSHGLRYDFPGAPPEVYTDFNTRVVVTESLAEVQDGPRPLVHAPVDVRIDGLSLAQEPPDVSAVLSLDEPTVVTWQVDPDSPNQPTSYRLAITELTWTNTKTYPASTVLAAQTSSTEFTVPPGILQPDRSYYLVMTSVYAPNGDESAPWRYSLPSSEAQIVTGLFSVLDP